MRSLTHTNDQPRMKDTITLLSSGVSRTKAAAEVSRVRLIVFILTATCHNRNVEVVAPIPFLTPTVASHTGGSGESTISGKIRSQEAYLFCAIAEVAKTDARPAINTVHEA